MVLKLTKVTAILGFLRLMNIKNLIIGLRIIDRRASKYNSMLENSKRGLIGITIYCPEKTFDNDDLGNLLSNHWRFTYYFFPKPHYFFEFIGDLQDVNSNYSFRLPPRT